MIQYMRGYFCGMVILALSTLLFIISFSTVHWSVFNNGNGVDVTLKLTNRLDRLTVCLENDCFLVDYDYNLAVALKKTNGTGARELLTNHGLWRLCLSSGCYTIYEGVSNWAQALENVCLVSLLLTLVVSILVFFFADRVLQSRTRLPEITCGVGSAVGLIGALVFMGQKFGDDNNRIGVMTLGWSFTMAVMATFGGLLSSVMLAFFNKFVPINKPYFLMSPHGDMVKLGQGQDKYKRVTSKSGVYTISH